MNRLSARTVYYVMIGMWTLASTIMFTTLTVYYVTSVGMNPLQLVLVGTVLEGTILLFEIPTGVVADTFSRRLSVIIGTFILGAAFLLESSLPLFAIVLLAEVVRGIGETFLSGATDAWLADEIGAEQVGAVYLRSGQINRLIGLLATVFSVALASLRLNLPLLVGGGLYLALGVFLLIAMPETGFTRAHQSERSSWKAMGNTTRTAAGILRLHPILLTFVAIGLFYGISSEGFDRLGEAHILTNFTFPALGALQPVVWFGIINISGGLFSLITTELFRRRMEAISRNPRRAARAIAAFNGLSAAAILVFALAGSFPLAFAVLLLKGAVDSLGRPLYSAYLVQSLPAGSRATLMSLFGQTDALGQVAGGPLVGFVGVARSLRAALALSGLLIVPAIPLLGLLQRSETAGNLSIAEETSNLVKPSGELA